MVNLRFNKIDYYIFIWDLLVIVFLPILLFVYLFYCCYKRQKPGNILQYLALGKIKKYRPNKKNIWFHAASIGELVALTPIIDEFLRKDKFNVILSTTSKSSAEIAQQRYQDSIAKGSFIYHANILELGFCIKLFLLRYNIALAIIAESEIWPRRVLQLAREKIPQILVNANISRSSFLRWSTLGARADNIFAAFSAVICQNDQAAGYFKQLGAKNIFVVGNLKANSKPMITDIKLLQQCQKVLWGRKIWAAVSTHDDEEQQILNCHKRLQKIYPDILLILVPRHIKRCGKIIKLLQDNEIDFVLKTELTAKLDKKFDVLLGNSFGDIGFYLSLSEIAFIGKSLAKIGGGHNPWEVLMLDNIVVSGHKTANFAKIYNDLKAYSAMIEVSNEEELYQAILNIYQDALQAKILRDNSKKCCDAMRDILNKTLFIIQDYIEDELI